MLKQIFFLSVVLCLAFMLGSCTTKQPPPTVDSTSVIPGRQVTVKNVDRIDLQGSILFLSIVPSIDTKVCEAQTHYLGEQCDTLPATVKRITISLDTPFAQTRFAKEAKLKDVQYLSDYKEGLFGRQSVRS